MARTYIEKLARNRKVPITDGKIPTRVMVTASDVVNAQKANSKSCALARASTRLPGVRHAYFFRQTAYLEYPDRFERFMLPISVQKEIVSFDRAKIFAPGSYQLSPPSASRSKAYANNYAANRKDVVKAAKAALRGPQVSTKQKLAKVSNKAPLAAAVRKIAAQDKPNPTKEQTVFNAKVSLILDKPAKHSHRTQYVRDAREPR